MDDDYTSRDLMFATKKKYHSKIPTYHQWAVTLTFNPKLLALLYHTEQWEYLVEPVLRRLQSAVLFKKVYIAFELTKRGWLHCHFGIETMLDWTVKTMRSQLDILFPNLGNRSLSGLYGNYFVTPSHDWDNWLSYIHKCQYFIERYKYAF